MSKAFKKKGVVTDVNKKITELVLAKLKQGQIPWLSPYQSTDYNDFTSFAKGEPYKGINKVLLWITKQEHQLQSNAFITFNQATEVAGITKEQMAEVRDKKKPEASLSSVNHPLAGQKSVGFVVYNSPIYKDKDGNNWSSKGESGKTRRTPTPDEIKKEGISQIWISKTYNVWSIDQMSHIPKHWQEKRNNAGKVINQDVLEGTQDERIKSAVQTLIQKNKIKVVIGDSPDYDHESDIITMPKINDFVSDNSFYRTLLHQIIHWSGHKDRLDRNFDTTYGENSDIKHLANEELVAELGSAFMCQKLGIDPFTSSNLEYHASMIGPWISLMDDNTKAISVAASRAEKSTDYLMKILEIKLEQSHEQEPSI